MAATKKSPPLGIVVERTDSPNPLNDDDNSPHESANGIKYYGELKETNISRFKSRTFLDKHKADNRTEQTIIDKIITDATSTKSKYCHEPDPLPWKNITPEWVEKHVDFDSKITVDEMLKRREVLKK